MEIHAEIKDRILIMQFKGRLDTLGAPGVQQCFDTYFKDDYNGVVFDLTDVEFIASAGIRVILIASKEAQARGGRLVLAGVVGYCLEILAMSGIVKMVPRCDTLDEALVACRDA